MSNLKRSRACLATAVVLWLVTASAQTPAAGGQPTASSTAQSADSAFATEAAAGGVKEVEAAQLAVSRASSADVKAFAQRMVNDHGKANTELMALASAKKVALPDEAAAKAKHANVLNRLEQLKGAEFDDRLQKADELRAGVTRGGATDDFARLRIERRVKR